MDQRPPPLVEIDNLRKRFGTVQALDGVSIRFEPGSFHALLGENGAGKSTLVKCLMGFYGADSGTICIDGRERAIPDPKAAHALGLGMVYQHFTLVPSMTVAENLLLARSDIPGFINWRQERRDIDAFLARMPFSLDPDAPAASLSAGEKQKLEIFKQLYLGARFLILDEPTSVLTPQESDEVLSHMRSLTDAGRLTVVLITHKFREVQAHASAVTVLRGGRNAGGGLVAGLDADALVDMTFGERPAVSAVARATQAAGNKYLQLRDVNALNARGAHAVKGVSLDVAAGEIVGIAGVSGNGQRELVEVLAGQRQAESGVILIDGRPFQRSRAALRELGVYLLAEEPLSSSCVPSLSVADNLALRDFDVAPFARAGMLVDRAAVERRALDAIRKFSIRCAGPDARADTLSGGNLQRAVLARELSGKVRLLVAQNPCFGLDFSAAREIRSRILEARNHGAAVLLLSEDLDELMELADRIVVMLDGRMVFETSREQAVALEIGSHMAGHATAHATA
ncbi:ABC transporter ATP-binding protein [Lacisediminimonas sp.]|uniref:ABC transporter ATP-binding protein n=1 Tax=Lacisediminimonas sp. TaxID=3060582 RepID=UPI00271E65BF|nr:ABC transporter ATP-binding protein [Lacisediminimonas sp.]MDO8299558.1 ABC transporter ATP-binding protein [Lacisediminimonas sp.]